MKNIKLYLSILLSALTVASCDMDRIPETSLSDASFWVSEDNFKQACNTLYTYLDGSSLRFDDNRSDFSIGANSNDVSSGSRITPSTSTDWDTPYVLINRANNIIEKAADTDLTSKNRWEGEARFFRAYAYYLLLTKYGGVPLVLDVLDIDSPELNAARADRAEIVQQIYEDLDFAAANLSTFTELGSAGYGRISKSAAFALKARVALYEGTRQKFHGYGTPSENLSIATTAAETVMAQGHTLYTAKPYYNLFQMDGEGYGNKENILAGIYGENSSNSIRYHNICRSLENGSANVTRPMIELYLCTDGLPYDQSPLAEIPETEPQSIFKNKDPRMDASLFKEGDPYGNPATYPSTIPGYIITGFPGRKYSVIADWQAGRSYVDVAMIRYAEILLIYAEAKFEKDGSISDADLDKSINLLRARVAMPHLTNAFVNANGLDMRTEIRRERSVELAQEGFRYDDIIRWKIAETVLPKEMVGATNFPLYGTAWKVNSDGYILAQTASTRSFNPDRDYLYPLPTREIALSGGAITQNPNW